MSLNRKLDIQVTKTAERDLGRIYRFIKGQFSAEIATKSMARLRLRIERLAVHPFTGKVDYYAGDTDHELRYVTVENSRIQYFVSTNSLVIVRVHDARQNPSIFLKE